MKGQFRSQMMDTDETPTILIWERIDNKNKE